MMPPICTSITTLVSARSFFFKSTGSSCKLSLSQSAKITLPPACTTAAGLAIMVLEGTITVLPATPIHRRIISSELVPLFVAIAYLVPIKVEKAFSNSATLAPMVRYPLFRTSLIPAWIAFISSSVYSSLNTCIFMPASPPVSGSSRGF